MHACLIHLDYDPASACTATPTSPAAPTPAPAPAPALTEALQLGYLSPSLPPPRGFVWKPCVGGRWSLVGRGG